MATEFNWNRKHVFAMIETTPGVYVGEASLFVSANILTMVNNLGFDFKPKMHKRAVDRGGLGSLPSMVGQMPASWKWSHPAFTSGAVGTAPAYAPFLRACKRKETISAGVSVTYTPDPDSVATLSVGWEVISEDGTVSRRYAASGVTGNAILKASEIGSFLEWEYSFDGAIAIAANALSPVGTTPITGITYPDMVANAVQFARFQSPTGLFAKQLSDMTLDFGVKTEMMTDITAQSGLLYGMQAESEPTLKAKFRSLPRATADENLMMALGTMMQSGVTFGTTAGKILQISTGANAQVEAVTQTNIGAAAAQEVTLALHASTTTVADDMFSVIFK